MLNCLMQRQDEPFLLAPCLQLLLVSMGADKAIAIHPCHQNFLALFDPERLHSPPFKHWQVSFPQIAALTCWNHVPTREMWTAFALGDYVVNRKLFFPFSAIGASTLPKWSPQKVIFKNTFAKSTFCVTRAKFNERIKQLIRTIRSWHGTI